MIQFHQDAVMIVVVDVLLDADVLPVQLSAETTAVYGLSFFSYSVADVAGTHSATDVMTVVYGLSFFSYSVADAEILSTETITADAATVDAMTAAVNQTDFKDGFLPSFFIFPE